MGYLYDSLIYPYPTNMSQMTKPNRAGVIQMIGETPRKWVNELLRKVIENHQSEYTA